VLPLDLQAKVIEKEVGIVRMLSGVYVVTVYGFCILKQKKKKKKKKHHKTSHRRVRGEVGIVMELMKCTLNDLIYPSVRQRDDDDEYSSSDEELGEALRSFVALTLVAW